MNRRSFLTFALLALTTAFAPAEERKIKVVLVGDSTVQSKSGWGDALAPLFKPEVEVVNLGKGGRSTKSYRTEGAWDAALKQKATHILIQFGHNDQPGKGPERETDPKSTYPENLARFVDEARAAGAEPILITSLVRRVFDKDNVHLRVDLEPYAEAVKKVGAEKKVLVLDLHARSKEQIEKLGPEGCKVLDADRKEAKPGEGGDKTHLCAKGAELTAPLVAEELRRVGSNLAPYLK